jgi:hypothetical protein
VRQITGILSSGRKLAAVDMGHATKAFVSVSASPSSRCRIASSSLFFFLVFTIFVIRDWAVRLRKAPQAHNWYFHASSATKKIIRHFSLGVESIERELKMLEEVHKGETYVAFRMSRPCLGLCLRCINIINCLCRRCPRKEQHCFSARLRSKRRPHVAHLRVCGGPGLRERPADIL